MPTYTFEFQCGQQIDLFLNLNGCPDVVIQRCPKYGVPDCVYDQKVSPGEDSAPVCPAKKVIVLGHGGIKRDEAVWIDRGLRIALQDTDRVAAGLEAPIQTRADLKRHLKANPHIAMD